MSTWSVYQCPFLPFNVYQALFQPFYVYQDLFPLQEEKIPRVLTVSTHHRQVFFCPLSQKSNTFPQPCPLLFAASLSGSVD